MSKLKIRKNGVTFVAHPNPIMLRFVLGVMVVRYGMMHSSRVRFIIRTCLFFAFILVSSLWGIGYALFHSDKENTNYHVGRFMVRLVRYLNVEVKVEGMEYLEHVRPCVFVSNHQSSLDVACM